MQVEMSVEFGQELLRLDAILVEEFNIETRIVELCHIAYRLWYVV
jgi:hypothetical protein